MTLSTYLRKSIIEYSVWTLCCLAFAVIYEFLGHGIHSTHIRLLFLIPLGLLTIVCIVKNIKVKLFLPAFVSFKMLGISEILRHALIGIFEVYGTTYSLVKIFSIFSTALVISTILLTVIGTILNRKNISK